MITINADTKISTLIKHHPQAMEAIISISPKFNKLRNPLLQRLMAARTSISMASKIGGCSVEDFFAKLEPLGFIVDRTTGVETESVGKDYPVFMQTLTKDNVVDLDVRSTIESGGDPITQILGVVNTLPDGKILKLINTFVPEPLIQLLGKKGYQSFSDVISEDLVYTYFSKPQEATGAATTITVEAVGSEGWDDLLKKYDQKLKTIDVRALEMPLPMLTILDELEHLAEGMELFVYHKRIPVFLLPELKERGFEYRANEIRDDEVHLLIYK